MKSPQSHPGEITPLPRDAWRPWGAEKLDPISVPTMITREEQLYLHWLTASEWRGRGVVLEVGSWLGGSTVCLASGIASSDYRERFTRPLHVVDNFIWRSFMAPRAHLPLNEGDSFEAEFRRNVKSYEKMIVVHRASLPDDPLPHDRWATQIRDVAPPQSSRFRWSREEPIEILFVDGAKSWDAMCYLLREVGQQLIAGSTLLVCQDYKYWDAYWVPMIMEYLSAHLEQVHILERNTVTFRLISPLTAEALESVPSFEKASIEGCRALVRTAQHRLLAARDPLGAAILQCGLVRFLGNKKMTEAACSAFRESESIWPIADSGSQLEQCREWLRENIGVHVKPSLRTRARRMVVFLKKFTRLRRLVSAIARRISGTLDRSR